MNGKCQHQGPTFDAVNATNFDHSSWFQANRHHLAGGGLWLSGDEPGRLPATAWDERPFRVLLSRLSGWHDTLESFTHLVLYRMLSEIDGCFPDMGWLPTHRDGEILSEAGIPWLLGGSHRDLRAFDVVGLSNALVQELLNVPLLLEKSGIPLSLPERQAREDLPLIVLGGANALQSSALWGPEALVDVVFLAEEPSTIQAFFARIRDGRAQSEPKESIRQALCEIPGAFLPDSPHPKTRKFHAEVPDLNHHLPLAPVPLASGVAGRGTVQVSEGCPWFCSFCAESWSRKPYREVPAEAILEAARTLKREQGLSKLDLYSFNFNTHASIRPLLATLLEEFSSVGLKSQRFDAIARDPSLVELLRIAGKTSITCALEGISPRMRAFLQKDLSDHDIDHAFDALLRARLRELKIFVIITGHEDDEDRKTFYKTLSLVREKLSRSPARPRIVVSATPLVRFPWTPLEFDTMPDPKTLSRGIGLVKAIAVSAGFEFRGAADAAEAWTSQVLARARSPRVLEAAQTACKRLDFVFRNGVTEEFREAFEEELALLGISPLEALAGYDPSEDVPWAQLEPGVERAFLVRTWQASQAFLQQPVCLGLDKRDGRCQACGACIPTERAAVTSHRDAAMPNLAALAAKVKAQHQSETPLSLTVELTSACRQLPLDLIHSRLARALMRAFPELTPLYRRCDPNGRAEDGDDCLATGLETLHPVLLPAGIEMLRQILSSPERLAAVNAEFSGYGKILAEGELPAETAGWQIRTPFRPDPGHYLTHFGLKHTLRRDGEARVFELPKDSLKKKLLRTLRLEETDGNWLITLEAGAKFSLRDFLREACAGEDLSDRFRVEATRVA